MTMMMVTMIKIEQKQRKFTVKTAEDNTMIQYLDKTQNNNSSNNFYYSR